MHSKFLLAPPLLFSLAAAQEKSDATSIQERLARATVEQCNPLTPEALQEILKAVPADQVSDMSKHWKSLPPCLSLITKDEIQHYFGLSTSPVPQTNTLLTMMQSSETNQCGTHFENRKCDAADNNGGPCCSAWGWCGAGPIYCGNGCQAPFSVGGNCNHQQSPSKPDTTSDKPKDGKPKEEKPKKDNPKEKPILVDPNPKDHLFPMHESLEGGICGKEYQTVCAPGLCCSHAGYCGKTAEYCSVPGNCQELYGWCDSFVVPKGYDVSKDKRKYNDQLPRRINKCTRPGTLALSFDDGPSQHTEEVLDVLKEFNARGTFFLGGILNGRGSIDQNWARVVRRMVTEGHQIGSHTWSHPDLNTLTSADRKTEMYKNERAIANVIGKYPTFVRAPMIRCNDKCMDDMKSLGYHVVDWQFDSEDWKEDKPASEVVVDRLKKQLNDHDGNMFLIQHDTHGDAAKVVRGVLENKRSDWQAVPLVECLGHQHEDAYRFPHYLEYSQSATDGCLFAGHDFCYKPQPFTNAQGCKDSVKKLANARQKCLKSSPQVCEKVEKVHKQLEHYCSDCEKSKPPSCDWTRFNAEI